VGRGAARAAARQAASEARSPAPGCPRHLRWADLAGADWQPVGGAATGGRGQVHGPRPVPGLGRARLFPARLGAAPAAAGCLGKAPRGKQGSAARRQRPARIPRPGQVWGQVAPPDRRRGAALALGLAGAKRPAMKKLGDVLDAQLGAAPPAGPPPVTPVPRGGEVAHRWGNRCRRLLIRWAKRADPSRGLSPAPRASWSIANCARPAHVPDGLLAPTLGGGCCPAARLSNQRRAQRMARWLCPPNQPPESAARPAAARPRLLRCDRLRPLRDSAG
jgi:hypothetical protein